MVKRILILVFIMVFLSSIILTIPAMAEEIPKQPIPKKIRIKDTNITEPTIGYNKYDAYYFDMVWDSIEKPTPNISQYQYVNVYYEQNAKTYMGKNIKLKTSEIPADLNEIRINKLKSGTVYDVTAKAYYTYVRNGTNYLSAESEESNSFKVLTPLNFSASALDVNKINIVWDDVWNDKSRIDYKIYVSESENFDNVKPILIKKEDVGKSVSVNENDGTLEYTYSTSNPGRVYYVKVIPNVSSAIQYNSDVAYYTTNSYILAQASRMSKNDIGTIWKMNWNSVLSGLRDNELTVNYYIKMGSDNNTQKPEYYAETTDTSFYLTVSDDDTGNNYYVIQAFIMKNGVDIHPDISIESKKIYLKESDVSATPPVPVIVEEFINSEDNVPIISFKSELTSNSATILWKIVKDDLGNIDDKIIYNIWLYSNPNDLGKEDISPVEQDFKPKEANYVYDNGKLVGYKYRFINLAQNKTYYFKIVAKKTFSEITSTGVLDVPYISNSAFKVITTPIGDKIDKPKSLNVPPLRVKKVSYPDGKDMLDKNSVTINLKNKWCEKFDSDTGKWKYIKTEKDYPKDTVDTVHNDNIDNLNYREVDLQSDYQVNIGYKEFVDGMDINEINDKSLIKIKDIDLVANDSSEMESYNTDSKKHNVDIKIDNLTPNTKYIIFAWLYNTKLDEWSEVSDSIVVTTAANQITNAEIPVIPTFKKGVPGDSFIDLEWNLKEGYKYGIKYGVEDKINKASNTVELKYDDLKDKRYYRVEGLSNNTDYYFWIMAVSDSNKSLWSDSLNVKTLAYDLIAPPVSFGIKSGDNSVTKNSIAFEWWKTDNIVYNLEIADNVNYYNKKSYPNIDNSTYIVENLLPNRRYYARLYSVDTKKNLISKPTNDVIVRTEKSSDEYDTNYENLLPDQLYSESEIDGKYNLSIKADTVDKLVDEVSSDSELDYIIPMNVDSNNVNDFKFTFTGKLLGVLSEIDENLVLKSDFMYVVINPKTLIDKNQKSRWNNDFVIDINKSAYTGDSSVDKVELKTDVVNLRVTEIDKSKKEFPITKFSIPIKVMFVYNYESWYVYNKTFGVKLGDNNDWNICKTNAEYNVDNNLGLIKFDLDTIGSFAVADNLSESKYTDISDSEFYDDINTISTNFNLKSIATTEFKPTENIKIGEVVKLLFDVMEYNYDENFSNEAIKAEIIDNTDKIDAICSREKALTMIINTLQIITSEKYQGKNENIIYTDMKDVNSKFLSKVLYAINMDIPYVKPDTTDTADTTDGSGQNVKTQIKLLPKENITKGEIMHFIKKMLELSRKI